MVQSFFKTTWKFPKMLNTVLSKDPVIPLLGIYPREMETWAHTKTCTQEFITALFVIAKKWK